MNYFPLGVSQYIVGGILVGLGIGLVYFFTGIFGGSSSVFSTTWSYVSSLKFFQQTEYKKVRFRKLVFLLGTVAGGVAYLLYLGTPFVTTVQLWRLAIGGFFVGLGARLGRGCTSGHGICGISAWSLPSLVSVCIFLSVAIIVAHLVSFVGVMP